MSDGGATLLQPADRGYTETADPDGAQVPPPGTDPPGGTTATMDHAHFKILLVDDNEAFIDGLAELLAADGHRVKVCYSGAASLAAAPPFAPDLVFLDMGLPDMDGFEVAKRLRADPSLSTARFVSISGCGDELNPRRDGKSFFSHSLVKPLRIEELEKLLARLQTERI